MRARLSAAGALVAGAALAGCTTSTGPVPAGPNTYVLTTRASAILGGADHAQADALQQADVFCRAQGRQMLPAQAQQDRGIMTASMTGFTVTFRCLLPTDPEFKR